MADPHNPLLPAGYDIAWSVAALAVIVLIGVALVTLARSAKRLTGLQALLWTLIVLFVPVVGALAWLFIGRPSTLAAGTASPPA